MKEKAEHLLFTHYFHATYEVPTSPLQEPETYGDVQANIVGRDPREERGVKMERVTTGELKSSSKHTRNFLERSTFMKIFLKLVGVLGVSLVMSGMIRWMYSDYLR